MPALRAFDPRAIGLAVSHGGKRTEYLDNQNTKTQNEAISNTADSTEAEWDAAIKTCVDEIDAGTANLIPLDEVEAVMDAFLASLCKA